MMISHVLLLSPDTQMGWQLAQSKLVVDLQKQSMALRSRLPLCVPQATL